MDRHRSGLFQWYHIYYILAALDIVTIACCMFFNHQLTEKYNASVESNRVWATRLTKLASLSRLGAALNAPSNDIFISQDVRTEREKLALATKSFNSKLREIRTEFYFNNVRHSNPVLWQDLHAIERRMAGMLVEAQRILDSLEDKKREEAIQQMAIMDKHYFFANDAMDALRLHISEIQQSLLDEQTDDVQRMKEFGNWIVFASLLMIAAITYYGFKLAKRVQIDTVRKAHHIVQLEETRFELESKTEQLQNALQDLQKAQLLVSESERKFRAIFDHTFQFIGLMQPDGVLLEANQTALDFVGAKKEDVVGNYFWNTPWWAHDHESQQHLMQAVHEAEHGEFIRFETTHPSSNGKIVSIDFSLKPVLDDKGKVIMLIPEGRDISDKKLAEQRVKEFYSTVSHELRTPLTAIRGSLGLIEGGLAGNIPAKAQTLVQIACQETDRLIRLINDILDLRKIEAGRLELNKKHVTAISLAELTASNLKNIAAESGLELRVRGDYTGNINCDEDRVIQILTNLVSNAIKFSDKAGVITISIDRQQENTVRFSVIDQGPGIEPSLLHKLFGRFQQIDQSDKRKNGGSGLGLAICKALVEQHGGNIGVESEPTKGSIFWFELPIDLEDNV